MKPKSLYANYGLKFRFRWLGIVASLLGNFLINNQGCNQSLVV